MDGETDCDLANLYVADEPLECIGLKSRFTELQKACRSADVAVPSSMIDVADFVLGQFLAFIAGDVFFCANEAFRRSAEVFNLQMKYVRIVAQLSSVTSE